MALGRRNSGGSVFFIPRNASFLKRDKNRTSLVLLPQGLVLKGSWLLNEHRDFKGLPCATGRKKAEREKTKEGQELVSVAV